MNIRILATATVTADSNIYGRALPALDLVRSIICPASMLPATMSMAESMGKMVRKVSTPVLPAAISSAKRVFRKYDTRYVPNRLFASRPQKGPMR